MHALPNPLERRELAKYAKNVWSDYPAPALLNVPLSSLASDDLHALADAYASMATHADLLTQDNEGEMREACQAAAGFVLAMRRDASFHFEELADELAVLGFSDTASRSVTAVAHIAENRREKRQRAEMDRRFQNAYGKPRRPKPQPQG